MGRMARRSKWRIGAVWQGLQHPHEGAYGLQAVLVGGLGDGEVCEVDVAVGPAGAQQECCRLTVRGSGTAVLPAVLNFRGGAPLWFRASVPGCVVATRTADLVGPEGRELSAPQASAAVQAAATKALARLGLTPSKVRDRVSERAAAMRDPERPRQTLSEYVADLEND